MKCEQILAPTDFSSDAEHALGHAIELAQQFQARLILLHVVYLYLPGAAEASFSAYVAKVKSEAEQEVAVCRKRAIDAGVTVDALVDLGVPAEKIVEVAKNEQVDLIVMGTQGRTGLQHLLLGSVAERVVRLAPCPVMVVPKNSAQE